MKEKIKIITIWVIMIFMFVFSMYFRFTHMNMTESQLFFKYWHIWLAMILILAFICNLVIKK